MYLSLRGEPAASLPTQRDRTRDPDNGHEEHDGQHEMRDRKPEAGEEEPGKARRATKLALATETAS